MKKTGRFALFTFFFLLGLFFCSNNINAAERTNVFDETLIGNFELMEVGGKNFNRRSENFNYTFTYDYMIYDITVGEERYIYDGASPIYYYYGFVYEAGKKYEVAYENITDPFLGVGAVSDEFYIYKYNSTNKEFNYVFSSGVNPKNPGVYEITEPGIYKVDTLIDGIGGKSAYLIYEPTSLGLAFKDNPFVVTKGDANLTIEANLIVRDLKNDMSECYAGSVVNVGNTEYHPSCAISKNEELNEQEFQGYYNITLTWTTTELVRNEDVTITYNGRVAQAKLVYDKKAPEISEFVYKNASLSLEGLEIVANDTNVLPHNSVAFITISDDNEIASVQMKYILDEAEKTTACAYDSVSKVASCYIDATKIPGTLTYEIKDSYDNVTSLTHTNSYDTRLLLDGETLQEHVNREENVFTAVFEGDDYNDIEKICIFYGEELSSGYECNYPSVSSSYYYKGAINIVVFDKVMNFASYKIDEVEFLNGYLQENFTHDFDIGSAPKFDNKLNATTYVDELKDIACGSDDECKDDVLVQVKYGDLVEEIPQDMILPTYGEILNKKYKDSLCASQLCDRTVEIIVNYHIGESLQQISAYISYVDKMPYINNQFTYDNSIELEYKKFDINNDTKLIQQLFGDELSVNLVDKNNVSYSGKISSVFVEYTNRAGVTTKLNNLPYNEIANMNEFGIYLLECRIQVLKDVSNDTIYQDTIYSKSFFIQVELSDKTKPVITLIGKNEMEVKQYGAYKEPGYRCVDESGCSVSVKYYLNDETNEVSEVNTDVVGKYIVKYVAIDGDGNQSEITTRTIEVVSVNSFDATSIIIIVAIVVVLAAIITTIIVLEVRKNKRMKEKEDF